MTVLVPLRAQLFYSLTVDNKKLHDRFGRISLDPDPFGISKGKYVTESNDDVLFHELAPFRDFRWKKQRNTKRGGHLQQQQYVATSKQQPGLLAFLASCRAAYFAANAMSGPQWMQGRCTHALRAAAAAAAAAA